MTPGQTVIPQKPIFLIEIITASQGPDGIIVSIFITRIKVLSDVNQSVFLTYHIH